jgi:hypothetical protein
MTVETVVFRIDIVSRLNELVDITIEKMVETLTNATHLGALMVVTEARRSIMQDPKTGRMYPNRNANGQIVSWHRASAIGETPANWTGKLVSSLIATRAEVVNGIVTAKATASAAICSYADDLEYGINMSNRPFMVVAGSKMQEPIQAMVEKMVKDAVKHG